MPHAGWSGNDAAKQTPSSAATAQQSSSAQSIMASTLPDPNANPLAIQPISTPGLAGSGRWIAPWQSCNPWSPHNSSLNGCITPQASFSTPQVCAMPQPGLSQGCQVGEGWRRNHLYHMHLLQATPSGRSRLYILTLMCICIACKALSPSQGELCPHVSPGHPLPTSLHSQAAASSLIIVLEGRPMRRTCAAVQAGEACPLPCASGSPDGCAQRFQCHKGCPLCIPPPQDRLCNGFKQVDPHLPMRQHRSSEQICNNTLHSCSSIDFAANLLARNLFTSIVLVGARYSWCTCSCICMPGLCLTELPV